MMNRRDFIPLSEYIPIRCCHNSVYLIGNFLRRELDVVHKGLLCLMTTDVHHLYDSEFVGQVHIGDTATPGGIGSHALGASPESAFSRRTDIEIKSR